LTEIDWLSVCRSAVEDVRGVLEELLGRALKQVSGARDRVTIATKFGTTSRLTMRMNSVSLPGNGMNVNA